MNVANATEVRMPKLSDSMEEGTILAWLVASGGDVVAGDDLLEVETDKANMTVQADGSGVLEILVAEGETVAVGTPIARFDSVSGATAPAPEPEPEAVADDSPEVGPEPQAETGPLTDLAPDRELRATPLAWRIARAHKINLGALVGTGPGGRITKGDVLQAAGLSGAPGPSAPPPATLPDTRTSLAVEGARGGSEIRELSRLQAVIARRMAEAKSTVPHFQVETEVRMDAAIDLRAKLKEIAGEEPAPSFNDMIVCAAALALRNHPKANASYRDGRFELHSRINVGIAVAATDALVVPTIQDADRRSLGEIGRESRRLSELVRTGSVTPPELAGGTFTVSNLGMFGMTAITPVINLPQAAILGVGMTRQLLIRGVDGEVEDAFLMTLTLSCDHRILYGVEAAQFLAEVRDLLESPLRLVL